MPFQSNINMSQPQGWHGDFATINSRVTAYGTDGAYQAGSKGINAGSFVWVDDTDLIAQNSGSGAPAGFVGRDLSGLITQYINEHSSLIPEGFMVTIYEKGEFLVVLPAEISAIKRGDVVYTDTATGQVTISDSKTAVETTYKYAASAKGGEMVAISSWI